MNEKAGASLEFMLFSLRFACRAFGVRALSSQGLPITTVRVSNDGVNQRKLSKLFRHVHSAHLFLVVADHAPSLHECAKNMLLR